MLGNFLCSCVLWVHLKETCNVSSRLRRRRNAVFTTLKLSYYPNIQKSIRFWEYYSVYKAEKIELQPSILACLIPDLHSTVP
jgi:hypothetical protein